MEDLSGGMKIYREEARELLSDLEASLLELEESPEDTELVGRVFRAMHTIKGSGAMFGFDKVASFTHEVETVFDMVRSGLIPVSRELINLTLLARDRIREMLDTKECRDEDETKTGELIASFKGLIPAGEEQSTRETRNLRELAELPGTPTELVTYRIRFIPNIDIFTRGINPLLLLEELCSLGEHSVIAYREKIPAFEDFNPEACYLYWDIILTTSKTADDIRDIFIFVEDDCQLRIDMIDSSSPPFTEVEHKKLGDILIERGDISPEELQKVLLRQKRIGEMLVEDGIVKPCKVQSALTEQDHLKKIREKRSAEETSGIRVAAEKLDILVNLVGELVTVQARLTRISSESNFAEVASVAEEIERLTSELRDNAMSIRMLPIGSVFGKFRRLVRDLSRELGKEIDLVTTGAGTELDKTVIEKLNDPLVHLIRNCIDHGMEPPAEREKAGKPARGRIHLSAVHSGANVLINVSDDGKGLDADAIRNKAVEKGLISQNTDLSERELFSLIFAAGFSTAGTITNVSGRGVGMDVVKKTIESLGGAVDIESRKGVGTTIMLKLPLTLAIIEGLQVAAGNENFIFPLSAVEECLELRNGDAGEKNGRRLVHVRGHAVSYIRIRELFGINHGRPAIEHIVIAGVDGHRIGFAVDNVIGQHQVVIKNLGRYYRDIEGISGATILGDGSVALILDIPKLVNMALQTRW